MKIFFFFLFLSCSGLDRDGTTSRTYRLSDVAGSFKLTLTQKKKGRKRFFEKKIFNLNSGEVLESSYILNKVDTSKKYWIPTISQSKIWIEKKEVFSQMKINPKLKVYALDSDSYEKIKAIKFIKEKFICAFSILPMCLESFAKIYRKQLNKGEILKLGIFWDQFPMTKEVYSRKRDVALESVSFYKEISTEQNNTREIRFSLESPDILMSLIFSKNLTFKSLHWVAQGLSLELE